jgi:hypothetical protein
MRISAHKRCGWLDRQKSEVGLISVMPADGTSLPSPPRKSRHPSRVRCSWKNTPLYDDVTTTIGRDRAPESVQIGHFAHGPCTAAKAIRFCPVGVKPRPCLLGAYVSFHQLHPPCARSARNGLMRRSKQRFIRSFRGRHTWGCRLVLDELVQISHERITTDVRRLCLGWLGDQVRR